MSSSSTPDSLCETGDTVCVITVYEKEVIVVPTLLLFAFLVTFVTVLVLRYCPRRRRVRSTAANTPQGSILLSQKHSHRRYLQGIDAPPELNVLEHEALPMTVQHTSKHERITPPAILQVASEWQNAFHQVTALPLSLSNKPNNTFTLHRARLGKREVILRVLKETDTNDIDRQHFLGFASFLSALGPHPFLPALVGVVSVQSPLVMAVEELRHRDLLGFLWRCRQDNSGAEFPCDLTEKRIFIMAGQVASALEYLHSQSCFHGNVGAGSVLVGGDLTAKLWGLGPAYLRKIQVTGETLEVMEMRKWQAPEVLARRAVTPSSDVWSFGILLYEMVTLGEPPFAQIMASELLQHLQRGKTVKRPVNCSNTLYSLIKSCCQWCPTQRTSMPELIRKLQLGEKGANSQTVVRVTEPLDIERYLREAGFGEAYNYAVL